MMLRVDSCPQAVYLTPLQLTVRHGGRANHRQRDIITKAGTNDGLLYSTLREMSRGKEKQCGMVQ